MSTGPALIEITAANVHEFPCCGIQSPDHPGRQAKQCWLRAHFGFGLRAKILAGPDGKPCGYIEYLPGEYAWRGVEAGGYMFIHCLWNHVRRRQGKRWGGAMIEACLADAKAAGMKGVAVLARDGPWLAGPSIFLANGFELVDRAPPDYQLLVRRFHTAAADPAFKPGWERRAARHGRGLAIVRSDQCPYIAKFAAEIARTAEEEYGLRPKIVRLTSSGDAQDAPTPYAVFAVLYKGRLLADHQISRTRFRNIMNGLAR